MSPHHLAVIGSLVLVTGGLAVLLDVGHDGRTTDRDPAGGDSPPFAASRKVDRPPAEPPVRRLRELPGLPLSTAPRFETVERWAGELTDAELRQLVTEAGMDDHKGLAGWLRCALFAEWGRRDPEEAAEYLNSLEWPGGNYNYVYSQAWYSLYRGWAGKDPEAVRLRLESAMESASTYPLLPNALGFDEQAQRAARIEVYRRLAELNPTGLWDIANLPPEGPLDAAVMKGILAGVSSVEKLQPFVDRWATEQLTTPEARQLLENHEASLRSEFTGFIPIPPREVIAREIALTLADLDLNAALNWLERNDPGIESAQINRVFNFHNDWARRHPQEALDRLVSQVDPDRAKVLAYGAFAGDLTLGPDIMQRFPRANDRWDVIFTAMSSGGSYHVDDFYPAPWKANPLRDFEANYEAVLATVAAAELPPEREADLLKRVHEEFCRMVPAAAKPVGAR